jgi:hypothetical protein
MKIIIKYKFKDSTKEYTIQFRSFDALHKSKQAELLEIYSLEYCQSKTYRYMPLLASDYDKYGIDRNKHGELFKFDILDEFEIINKDN